MSLRDQLVEAGARDLFDVADLGELHPEDQETGIQCAKQMLDSFLDTLEANARVADLDFDGSLTLADEVALTGLSGLITVLRPEEE